MYARVTRMPPRDFAFWAKSLRGQLTTLPSLTSMQFSAAECFLKLRNRNLLSSLWERHICAPWRGTNMAARNIANIWFQYCHKFDQLFTANEKIIPLNTFSNSFTTQRA